jgi:dTDP-glucose pyrophosphorylase
MISGSLSKAVIMARGLGTRMRRSDGAADLDRLQAEAADAGLKAMIPVGRPFLDYVLSALADAGYSRICLVVGPEHDVIRDYYTRQAVPRRLGIEYAVQPEPRGTADAVAAAEAFAAGDDFLVINSDNYYPPESLAAVREGQGPGTVLFEQESLLRGGNIPAERVRRFAVAKIDAHGFLTRIIEKPDDATLASLPRPLWLSMNCWRLSAPLFDACRAIKPSPRGEFELTDAVQYSIDVLGQRYRTVGVHSPVLDLTSRGDVAAVTALLADTKVEL